MYFPQLNKDEVRNGLIVIVLFPIVTCYHRRRPKSYLAIHSKQLSDMPKNKRIFQQCTRRVRCDSIATKWILCDCIHLY